MSPHRIIPLASLGLIIGLGVFYSLPFEPGFTAFATMWATLAVLSMCCGFLHFRSMVDVLWRWLPAVFVFAVAVIGFTYGAWHTTQLANRFDEVKPLVQTIKMTGELRATLVELEPYRRGGFVGQMRLENGLTLRIYDRGERLSSRLIGCELSLNGRLFRSPPRATEHGYDPRSIAFFAGEVGRFAVQSVAVDACASQNKIIFQIAKWREIAAEQYREVLSPSTSALASALLFGFRGALPESTKENYRWSGLAHILAISGLHMAIVAGGLFALIRFVLAVIASPAGMLDSRRLSAGFALVGALGYLFLSGASYATQRAFIMIACVFLAVIMRRPVISIHTAALAAFFILLLNPAAIRSPGFLMSFAAVIALITFYQWYFLVTKDMLRRERSLWQVGVNYVVGLSLTSVVAGLATGAIGLYFFNQMAVYSLLANLLAMPIFVFWVMPSLVLSYVLMWTPLFLPLARIVGQGLDNVSAIAAWIASLPGAVAQLGLLPDSFLVAACIIIIGLAGQWWRRKRLWLIPALMLAVLVDGRPQTPDIYILGRGREIAYRDEAGRLALTAAVQDDFIVKQWFALEGEAITQMADDPCGARYCRLNLKGQWRLDIAYSPQSLSVACQYADIVISPVKRRAPCEATYLYSGDYEGDAVHTLYANGRPQDWPVINTRDVGQRVWHRYKSKIQGE